MYSPNSLFDNAHKTVKKKSLVLGVILTEFLPLKNQESKSIYITELSQG